MLLQGDVDDISNSSFAHLDESVDRLARLPIRALPTRSSNRFTIAGVVHDASQQRFLSARPTRRLDPRPSFDVIVLDARHERSAGSISSGGVSRRQTPQKAEVARSIVNLIHLHDAERYCVDGLTTFSESVVAERMVYPADDAGGVDYGRARGIG